MVFVKQEEIAEAIGKAGPQHIGYDISLIEIPARDIIFLHVFHSDPIGNCEDKNEEEQAQQPEGAHRPDA